MPFKFNWHHYAATHGKLFMYRNSKNRMIVSDEASCTEGLTSGFMYNTWTSETVIAPTDLPPDKWVSSPSATLVNESIKLLPNDKGDLIWAPVPEMRITVVLKLDDDDPTMAAAFRKLAALA